MLLICNFIPLWPNNRPFISTLLHLWRLVLCSGIWSVVENIPCELQNCAVGVWMLHRYVRCSWFIVLFTSSVSLLILCLLFLFIVESLVFILAELSIFLSILSTFASQFWQRNTELSRIYGLCCGVQRCLQLLIDPWWILFYHYKMSLFL